MEVYWNGSTPKSSTLIGFSINKQSIWGTPIGVNISNSYPPLNRLTHRTLPFTLSPMVPMVLMVHLRRQEQGICNGRREVPRRPAGDPVMVGLFKRCGAMKLRFDFAGLSTNETIRADVGLSKYWVLRYYIQWLLVFKWVIHLACWGCSRFSSWGGWSSLGRSASLWLGRKMGVVNIGEPSGRWTLTA
jgi:hypothetical protein